MATFLVSWVASHDNRIADCNENGERKDFDEFPTVLLFPLNLRKELRGVPKRTHQRVFVVGQLPPSLESDRPVSTAPRPIHGELPEEI